MKKPTAGKHCGKKRVHPVVADTVLHPYNLNLKIIFCHDLVGAANEFNISPDSLEERAGFSAGDDAGNQFIALLYSHLSYGMIAHEAFHCVVNVMKHIGQPIVDGEEAAAYLLQHIIDCVITSCKQKKININDL